MVDASNPVLEMDILFSFFGSRVSRISPKPRSFRFNYQSRQPCCPRWLFEAVASLESATAAFLRENSGRVSAHKKVLQEFTCEIDPFCQEVLQKTYKCCNFPDITDLDLTKKTQWCSVHEKQCRTQKHSRKNRYMDPLDFFSFSRLMHHPL